MGKFISCEKCGFQGFIGVTMNHECKENPYAYAVDDLAGMGTDVLISALRQSRKRVEDMAILLKGVLVNKKCFKVDSYFEHTFNRLLSRIQLVLAGNTLEETKALETAQLSEEKTKWKEGLIAFAEACERMAKLLRGAE